MTKLFLFMYTIPHAETHVYKHLPNDKAVSFYVYNTSCKPLPNDKFLDVTKMRAFADNK